MNFSGIKNDLNTLMKLKIFLIIIISYCAVFIVNAGGHSFGEQIKIASLKRAYTEANIEGGKIKSKEGLINLASKREAKLANPKASEEASLLLTISLITQMLLIIAIAAISTYLINRGFNGMKGQNNYQVRQKAGLTKIRPPTVRQ